MKSNLNILAIHPWIYDFAAYDFWLKPYGFLSILTYLDSKGANIDYIDCLDKKIKKDSLGRGKYLSTHINKPDSLKHIPRIYKRYGIPIEELKEKLKTSKPDIILISSSMTYWYTAIIDLLDILNIFFPNIPILIGGTYVTLCHDHAKKTFPNNVIIFKNDELQSFFNYLDIEYNEQELCTTLPDYEKFYKNIDYVVFRASWGCPYSCSYCAIQALFPKLIQTDYKKVARYIEKYAKLGIKEFIFYDDALLYDLEYIKNFLKLIISKDLKVKFHTPNALHLKFIDYELAVLLKSAGFLNPHFGLETLDSELQSKWSTKVSKNDLTLATKNLKKAGYKDGDFSVYLLFGYPNQNIDNLEQEATFLHSLGAKVSLSEYSPVPKTVIFNEVKEKLNDPLLHNNSVFSFFIPDQMKKLWTVKNQVKTLNKSFSSQQKI